MKPVYQTRFRGPTAPLEEQGNCGQAVVASLLEIPLEDAFDVCQHNEEDWQDAFIAWLRKRGYGMITVQAGDEVGGWFPPGLCMGHTWSLNGIPHVVVLWDGEVVHDPAQLSGLGPFDAATVIYPINPVRA